MTDHDLELIEEAESTTYRSTIYRCIEEADTEEARQVLMDILENPDSIYED